MIWQEMVWAHKLCREPVQRAAAESGLCDVCPPHPVLDYLPEMLNIISANWFLEQPSPSVAWSSRCRVLHQLFLCLNKCDWLHKQKAEREIVLLLSSEMDFQDTGPVVYHTLSSDITFFDCKHLALQHWYEVTPLMNARVHQSWPSVLPVNCLLRPVNKPTLSTRI